MGVRVHTLAKELNRSSKELMEILRGQGIVVKNHFSSVDETTAAKLRIQFGGEDSIRKPEKQTKAKAKPKDKEPEAAEAVAESAPVEETVVEAPKAKAKPVKVAPKAPVAETSATDAGAAETTATEETPPPAATSAPPKAAETSTPDSEPKKPAAAASDAGDDSLPGGDSPGDASSDDDAPPAAASADAPPKTDEPPKPSRKVEMAPGFGGTPTRPKVPVAPVARPMPAGGKPPARPRKARPLIIRSKPTTPAPSAAPRRGPGGGPPGRGGPGGPGRGPGGPGRGPGGPGRGPGGPGRGPGGGGGRGFGGGGGGGGTSAPGKVRFFPGDGGMPPGAGGPPGKGGRRSPGGGRRTAKHRGGGKGRHQQRESFEYFRRQRQEEVESGERPSELKVPLPITLKELSPLIGVKHTFLLKAMMEEKVLVNVNSALSEEMLLLIGEKFSVLIEVEEAATVDSSLEELETTIDPDDSLIPRAPVVTILGHVDHGKTSLLDKIRETRVTQGESGGITQHISAYRVDHEDKHVVFIDTPGHKAFTEMRARGANVTDVAVLVVAADDGPMPQTEEAMQHAQAAGVPIVVAINKVDRPNANVNRAKQMLAEIGLAPPDWGGTTEMVEVSALQGTGIDDLLELLTLETQILDLKANPNKNAIGTVLEARATTGRGNVITVLIQEGTLKNGDVVICGPAHGKVRTLSSTVGIPLDSAGPSTPVEITGLNDLPAPGDRFYAIEDLGKAREIAEDRQRRKRAADRMDRSTATVTLEGLFDHISSAKTKEIKLVIKTDGQGSLEVLKKELSDLKTDEVAVRVLRGGVGEITEDDVLLADASEAIVIGFHVNANQRAKSQADEKGVEIRTYEVIYQVIEEMRLALEGMLEPEIHEEAMGKTEILQIFRSSKLGNIAGCMVRDGLVRRDDPIRLVRDGKMIFEGKLDSLKRVKDDVKEVKEGFECGLRIQGFSDIQVGDIVESYKKVATKRRLADLEAEARRKAEEEKKAAAEAPAEEESES